MNFLAPWFLVGALAIGGPIVFHLIRRTTRERTPFSSLMFLAPSAPRLTRRSRLEHILLLTLRCLVIGLLALGFARPFFNRVFPPPVAGAARRELLLIDTSASMRRADLWSEAKARALAAARQASAVDELAVYTFGHTLSPVLTFDEWKAAAPGDRVGLVQAKLNGISPGWTDTRLGSALIQAAEILADNSRQADTGARELRVISDLQQGSHLEPVQGYEWPRGMEVTVEPLRPRHAGNASVQMLPETDDSSAAAPGVRVRVSNNPDSRHEQFRLGWVAADGQNFSGVPQTLYVPAGQSRTVMLPAADRDANRIRLTGDQDEFDNTVFVVQPEPEHLTVVYVGSDPPGDSQQPLYFLQRALPGTRRRTITVTNCSPDKLLPPDALAAASLLVVTEPVPAESIRRLRERVNAGTMALLMLKNPGDAAVLQGLLGLEHLAAEEVHPANYALLADIDFQHPLFAPFADPRFSDFTKIHFWKYRKLDSNALPGARALARFDNGDPALLELSLGRGKILVLTSGWQPSDSQLALSTKFIPLLYSLLDLAGAPAPASPQFRVGETVPLPRNDALAGTPLAIRCPDGTEVSLAEGQTNFSGSGIPGVYTVELPVPKRFAINLDPAESLTVPLPIDEFERLGVPLARTGGQAALIARRQARLASAEQENRQKLWRWVLLAAVGLVLGETWLSGWTARRQGAVVAHQPGTA